MVWWQFILFPFAIAYDGLTRIRNHLFNIDYTRSFQFEVKTVAIGNLTVGGTGKTPFVTYLVEQLKIAGKQPSIISRGYGRKTTGYLGAQEGSTANDIGDEPMQFFLRYGSQVPVAVGEERALAIPQLLMEAPDVDVVVLDDAYQHRKVKPHVNILLTTMDRPFFHDYVMPSGLLRESRKEARRADMIVVTKCPAVVESNTRSHFKVEIQKYAPEVPVFFSRISYGKPVPFRDEHPALPDKWVVVSGLANNQSFVNWCQSNFRVEQVYAFRDHHNYGSKDIKMIGRSLKGGVGLITTEKDFVKLREFEELQDCPCFYLPIAMEFVDKEQEFLDSFHGLLEK